MFVPLLLLAFALSVNSAAVTKECQLSAGDVQCLVQLQHAVDKIDALDVDKAEDLKPFQEACKAMSSCMNILKCAGKDSQDAIDQMKGYCKFVDYISGPFVACADKLDKINSKCYEDWDPIPDNDEDKEVSQAEICKSIVGENGCIKKEIIATCGQNEWDNLKTNLVYINKDVSKCNF